MVSLDDESSIESIDSEFVLQKKIEILSINKEQRRVSMSSSSDEQQFDMLVCNEIKKQRSSSDSLSLLKKPEATP